MKFDLLSTRFAAPVVTPTGCLTFSVYNHDIGNPLADVKIRITSADSEKILHELATDSSGKTIQLDLPSPDRELSLTTEHTERPYSEYNAIISADGYATKKIQHIQILSGCEAILEASLSRPVSSETEDIISIKSHTLWGEYPGKIPEAEEKLLPNESGFAVLDQPVIPEAIIVHDGLPDMQATNYYIKFKDYIKNVATSTIYPTWPKETIRANVLAIISFTLNRVFTEWYRSTGKNFTITSSSAYDQPFFYGRNTFSEISIVVDEIFSTYLTKPDLRQPLLSQYCDSRNPSYPNRLIQWNSKELGEKGCNSLDILRRFYGSNVHLTQATKLSGIVSPFPGTNFQAGSHGDDIRLIQGWLNGIGKKYLAMPTLLVDGIFGEATKSAVKIFQEIFYLPQNGTVDYSTWYKISDMFVETQKLSELL